MSVCVITSPLTIAVALTTDGIAVPKPAGFSGRWSDWLLFGSRLVVGLVSLPAPWHRSRLPAATRRRAINARVLNSVEKLRATMRNSLDSQPLR